MTTQQYIENILNKGVDKLDQYVGKKEESVIEKSRNEALIVLGIVFVGLFMLNKAGSK
jgi:hypothetical protein